MEINSNNKLRFWFAWAQNSGTLIDGTTTLVEGETYIVRQYCDGTRINIDLSDDGGETWTTEISTTNSDARVVISHDTGFDVNIGRSRWQSSWVDYFQGDIKKFKVIEGSSDPDDIPTSYYRFDNAGTDKEIYDQYSLYDGQAYNGATQYSTNVEYISGFINQYSYDYLGRKTTVTNGEGAETEYTYDDLSRLLTVTQSPDGGTTEYVTEYTYDTVSGDYIISQIEDAEGGIKQTWYDNLGRVYKEVNDGTDDQDSLIIESVYHYDALGRLMYKEFEDGTILGNTYDSRGYLWKEKYYDSYTDYAAEDNDDSPEDSADRTYTDYTFYVDYDSRGNLKRIEGEIDGEEFYHEWKYDSKNRVTQQTEHLDINSNTIQNVITYAYWDNGSLKSVTYPATFGNDHNTVSQKYYYNEYGQLTDIMLDSSDVRSYVYDDSGKVIQTDTYIDQIDTGDIISTYYDYNDAGLTTDIQYKLNGTLKERYQYGYDNNGMITSETITPYAAGGYYVKSHTYDDIGRLTETTIGDDTDTYTYDDVGNRLTLDDGTDSWDYIYDALFQLDYVEKNDVTELDYSYDIMGNQTSQMEYDASETLIEEQTFTYHNNGMLKNVLIEDSDGTDPDENEFYLYNGKGQRIVKEFDDGTDTTMTRYLYTGTEVIMTANSAGLKTTENILTPSGQIITSQRFDQNGDSTGWYSFNYDIRQSTTAIVDSAGTLQNDYQYDAFGNTTKSGSLLNEVEFTGAISDNNTGLYYMNARYYNSNTGRFISQDSYKGSAYEPWTQNIYTYCGNNPVNMVDPTGHVASFATMMSDGGGRSRKTNDDYYWWLYYDDFVVPDPEPEKKDSETVTLSDGRIVPSNDEGTIAPSLSDLYYMVPELNKDDSIDYMLQRPSRNFGDTGVYYIDFSYNIGPSFLGYTGGYSYVINTNEGWVAEYEHVGPYVGFGLSPLPASGQYTTGVVYGDMGDPTNYEGFFFESSFSIVGSYANAVSFLGDGGYNAVSQQGTGIETNVCASAGVNYYTLTNLVYINGG